jgi:hypothetical protein
LVGRSQRILSPSPAALRENSNFRRENTWDGRGEAPVSVSRRDLFLPGCCASLAELQCRTITKRIRSVYADPAYASTVTELKAELERLRQLYESDFDPQTTKQQPAAIKKSKAARQEQGAQP